MVLVLREQYQISLHAGSRKHSCMQLQLGVVITCRLDLDISPNMFSVFSELITSLHHAPDVIASSHCDQDIVQPHECNLAGRAGKQASHD